MRSGLHTPSGFNFCWLASKEPRRFLRKAFFKKGGGRAGIVQSLLFVEQTNRKHKMKK